MKIKPEGFEDKSMPRKQVLVKIKIKDGRRIADVGGPGDVVEVDPVVAELVVGIGYAEIVEE